MIIYADNNPLSDLYLVTLNITFNKKPYEKNDFIVFSFRFF